MALSTLIPVVVATPALAAQSITVGSNTCTVTAVTPTLNKTTLTGSVTVKCTIATTVTVEFGVVEMDGTTEDTRVPIPIASRSLAITRANTLFTVSVSATCLNTETGNEEYATKARVGLSGPTSSYDRTTPANDQFAC